MLQLINLYKNYNNNQILKDINLSFNSAEKVMLVGPSGSGKTTLLNIIFGLDKPSKGMVSFKKNNINKINLDEYHRQTGFIVQNYNLLDNLSVYENIAIAQSIGGEKNNKEILLLLKQVGLENFLSQQVQYLSGGQKQRVAIARALVNNPKIILADEPTGSLDSKSSIEIMDLLLKLTQNKLLIMVTHDQFLAKRYGTRIITILDGEIVSDTKKTNIINEDKYVFNKPKSMNLITQIKLSLLNIKRRKIRFILTTIATSIGLLGLSIVIVLANNFRQQIIDYENQKLKSFPIIVNQTNNLFQDDIVYNYPNNDLVISKNKIDRIEITPNQLVHLDKINKHWLMAVGKRYIDNYQIITKNHNYSIIDQNNIITLPLSTNNDYNYYLKENFDLIKGNYPLKENEIVLIVNGNNEIANDLYSMLNLSELFKQKFNLLSNNQMYYKINNQYHINNNYQSLFENKESINLRISGIIRGKKDNQIYQDINGLGISENIINRLISLNSNSQIYLGQIKSKINLLTGENVNNIKDVLLKIGYNDKPLEISFFPINYQSRDKIIKYLNQENIPFVDYAKEYITLTNQILNSVLIVLSIFSIISIIVVIFMIGILSYINILENRKEIGILRMLGTRKKDLIHIFNLENVYIALISSSITSIFTNFIFNILLNNLLKITKSVNYELSTLLFLIPISIIICTLGGGLPIRKITRQSIVNNLING